MIVLEVLGFEDKPEGEQFLIENLAKNVASVRELRVTPKFVVPYIIRAGQEVPGRLITVKVSGLYEREARFVDVRKMLCRKIYLAVWNFLQVYKNPKTESIVIFLDPTVNPQDRDCPDYYESDPKFWRPEMVLQM